MLDQLQLWLVDKGKGALWTLTNKGAGLDRLERVFVKLHVLFQTVKPLEENSAMITHTHFTFMS